MHNPTNKALVEKIPYEKHSPLCQLRMNHTEATGKYDHYFCGCDCHE